MTLPAHNANPESAHRIGKSGSKGENFGRTLFTCCAGCLRKGKRAPARHCSGAIFLGACSGTRDARMRLRGGGSHMSSHTEGERTPRKNASEQQHDQVENHAHRKGATKARQHAQRRGLDVKVAIQPYRLSYSLAAAGCCSGGRLSGRTGSRWADASGSGHRGHSCWNPQHYCEGEHRGGLGGAPKRRLEAKRRTNSNRDSYEGDTAGMCGPASPLCTACGSIFPRSPGFSFQCFSPQGQRLRIQRPSMFWLHFETCKTAHLSPGSLSRQVGKVQNYRKDCTAQSHFVRALTWVWIL